MAATIQSEKLVKELAELWVSLAASEPSNVSNGVLRACAMTLIVFADEHAEVGETLAQLMHEHPSRAIVLRLSAEPGLKSRVFAECWMPFGKRQQICCEQIEITAGAGDLADLPPVLRGITVPDLPVVLWVRRPELLDNPACEQILPLVDKVILDSAAASYPSQILKRFATRPGRLADLAWARLTHWRESVAATFETGGGFARIACTRNIRLRYSTPQPAIETRYLAAWFHHVLGDRAACVLEHIGAEPPAPVEELHFSGDHFDATLARSGDSAIELRVDSLTLRHSFTPSNDYELLREELSILGADPVFEAVLRAVQS